MQKLFLLFFTFLCFNFCQGQSVVNTPSQYESTWRLKQIIRDRLNRDEKANPISFEDIKGSPYLTQNFETAQLIINDSIYGSFPMRYNIYNDEIQIMDPNVAQLNNPNNEEFDALLKLNGTIVKFKDATLLLNDLAGLEKYSNTYIMQLFEGKKFSLYQKKTCKLTPAEKAASPNQSDRAAKFNIYDAYFLYNHIKKEGFELSLKKKDLKVDFQNDFEAVYTFVKKEKIKKKSPKSLLVFLEFLNNLN